MVQIMNSYHIPVLLEKSVEQLVHDKNGLYVDVTYGGGGHSKKIIQALSDKGRLVGFDQDEEARLNAIDDARFTFVKSNFRYLYRYWKWLEVPQVDGILADLGVSSHQFDVDYRGFSYRFEGEIDMRMNENSKKTAATILNEYTELQLKNVFSRYGEIRNSKTLARSVIDQRKNLNGIYTTSQLNEILDKNKVGSRNKYFSQAYQALRIEVNDEMKALEELLLGSLRILKPGGRLVVISYHSLEDRMVKRFFKFGNLDGEEEKDLYGKSLSPIKSISKLIVPEENEQKINVRSRSAKMRVGQKV